jgi:hypothetical protein
MTRLFGVPNYSVYPLMGRPSRSVTPASSWCCFPIFREATPSEIEMYNPVERPGSSPSSSESDEESQTPYRTGSNIALRLMSLLPRDGCEARAGVTESLNEMSV